MADIYPASQITKQTFLCCSWSHVDIKTSIRYIRNALSPWTQYLPTCLSGRPPSPVAGGQWISCTSTGRAPAWRSAAPLSAPADMVSRVPVIRAVSDERSRPSREATRSDSPPGLPVGCTGRVGYKSAGDDITAGGNYSWTLVEDEIEECQTREN